MAQARVAAGAVLSTVEDTAKAISGIVNTVSGTLEMANNFVRYQQNEQRENQKIATYVASKRRRIDATVELAQLRKGVQDMLTDPDLESYYNEEFAALAAQFDVA